MVFRAGLTVTKQWACVTKLTQIALGMFQWVYGFMFISVGVPSWTMWRHHHGWSLMVVSIPSSPRGGGFWSGGQFWSQTHAWGLERRWSALQLQHPAYAWKRRTWVSFYCWFCSVTKSKKIIKETTPFNRNSVVLNCIWNFPSVLCGVIDGMAIFR